jgi:hypothetical protein
MGTICSLGLYALSPSRKYPKGRLIKSAWRDVASIECIHIRLTPRSSHCNEEEPSKVIDNCLYVESVVLIVAREISLHITSYQHVMPEELEWEVAIRL